MRRVVLWGLGVVAASAIATAGYVEHQRFQSNIDRSIGMIDPSTVKLESSPIKKEWVLDGNPDTRSGEIARTADGSTHVVVWSTTASRFNWHYDFDESVMILDGEVFISDNGKPERRLGPGDVIFFPHGSHAIWRVPHHVRKLATFKYPLPGVVASLLRWAHNAKGWMRSATAGATIEARAL